MATFSKQALVDCSVNHTFACWPCVVIGPVLITSYVHDCHKQDKGCLTTTSLNQFSDAELT